MKYIDSHVHVWTDNFDHYPLAAGVDRAEMEIRRFLPEQILAHARPSGVDRIVLIQMSYYQTDNRYMLDVIRHDPATFRGIAIIDENGPAPEREMRRLKDQGVRGFRIQPQGRTVQQWLSGPGYEAMFRCGAEERLAMCPLINPEYLASVSRACSRFPETPVIIDHLARIGIGGPPLPDQVDALCRLAEFPQVQVKVSAFYALGSRRPPHLDLSDLIRRVHAAYGRERLMWASDAPFQILNETYEDSIALIRDHLDFLSAEDRQWILRKTAEQFFF